MKFGIKNPRDHSHMLLDMIPEEFEGAQVLKIIFPEKDSILMIRKNGKWINAVKTDLSDQLVNAISKGIHAHIRRHKIYRDPLRFKSKIALCFLFLVMVLGQTSCSSDRANKGTDSLMTDSVRIDTASNPIGGIPDTLSNDTTRIKKDSLHLDTL